MLKRIIAAVLLVTVMVGMVPMLFGCEDEVKTTRTKEIKDREVEQHEVVE